MVGWAVALLELHLGDAEQAPMACGRRPGGVQACRAGGVVPTVPPLLSLEPLLHPCTPPPRLVLCPSDVDAVLAPLQRLRLLVLSRQPAGYGFGPYISAATGAAWDTSSVAALMHLARRLPQLAVELERTLPPCLPPSEQGREEEEPATAAL